MSTAICQGIKKDGHRCRYRAKFPESSPKFCGVHYKGTKQCAAYTQKNERCSRNAVTGSQFCWQHEKVGSNIPMRYEQMVEMTIRKMKLQYTTQKTWPNLRGVGNGLLRYDFYIPRYNLLIECDEKHHFKKNSTVNEHDRRKKEYISMTSDRLSLLNIPYFNIENSKALILDMIYRITIYGGGFII